MIGHPSELELQRHAEGETGDDAVRAHVGHCAQCAETVRYIRAVLDTLRQLPVDLTPPDSMLHRILRELTCETARERAHHT